MRTSLSAPPELLTTTCSKGSPSQPHAAKSPFELLFSHPDASTQKGYRRRRTGGGRGRGPRCARRWRRRPARAARARPAARAPRAASPQHPPRARATGPRACRHARALFRTLVNTLPRSPCAPTTGPRACAPAWALSGTSIIFTLTMHVRHKVTCLRQNKTDAAHQYALH